MIDYIHRITLEENGDLKMWRVFIFYVTGKATQHEYATLPEALAFVNQKVSEEIELDSIPF